MTDAPQKPTANELGEKLTNKQRQFSDIYLLNGLNARAAAREVGYKNPAEGSRTLGLPHVAAYVRARLDDAGFTRAEIARKLQYFAESDMRDFLTVAPGERSYWVRADQHEELREAAKKKGVLVEDLDNYDVAGIVGGENVALTEDGVTLVCVRRLDAEVSVDWRAAERAQATGRIKKVKLGKEGAVEFELHDPLRALELLGKAQKMFTDRVETVGDPNAPLQVVITRTVVREGGEP